MGKITQLARELRKNATEAEKILWECIRNKKINGMKIHRQQPIIYNNIDGHKYFIIADFCCYAGKLIIEVDGGIHLLQKDYDKARDMIVKDLGFKILRVNNEEVIDNFYMVIKKIQKEIGQAV